MLRLLWRFSTIGVLATLLYLVGSAGAMFLGVPALVASLCGYALGFVVSFYGQLKYTFRIRQATTRNFYRFLAMSLFGLMFAQSVIWVFVRNDWDVLYGICLNCLVIPGVNFVLSKYWVFDNSPET